MLKKLTLAISAASAFAFSGIAAAETFNDGLRAYYFSFALLAWFVSPMAMVIATVIVVAILYSREFRSEVLHILKEDR